MIQGVTDGSSSFLVISDVIMTSLLLLKVIYMLANFSILSNTLLHKYFSFNVYS